MARFNLALRSLAMYFHDGIIGEEQARKIVNLMEARLGKE